MKRLILVVGFPVLLGVLWWSSQHRVGNATAEVSIDSSNVVELRGVVLNHLAAVGAIKTGEDTSYQDDGHSDLTFRVPPARLEEALVELNAVGGTVTRQQVDLEELYRNADDVSSSLDSVGGCLSRLADRLSSRSINGATADLNACRSKVDVATKQIDHTPAAATDAILNVHISKPSATNAIVVIAIALLAVGLVILALVTFRSARHRQLYDITEDGDEVDVPYFHHHRWN